MTEHRTDEGARRSRWWQWLSGSTEADAAEPGTALAVPASGSRDPTAREVWLPAKRRMIRKIADFLIDHDLEILPATLTVAYECVTGGAPRLAQHILERTEKGLPVTLGWLEDQRGESNSDKTSEALVVLMGRLKIASTSSAALQKARARRRTPTAPPCSAMSMTSKAWAARAWSSPNLPR